MKAREIAELVGGELRGDGDVEIHSVSDFSTAGPSQIAFVETPDKKLITDAACVFVPPGFDPLLNPDKDLVIVTNPQARFCTDLRGSPSNEISNGGDPFECRRVKHRHAG